MQSSVSLVDNSLTFSLIVPRVGKCLGIERPRAEYTKFAMRDCKHHYNSTQWKFSNQQLFSESSERKHVLKRMSRGGRLRILDDAISESHADAMDIPLKLSLSASLEREFIYVGGV